MYKPTIRVQFSGGLLWKKIVNGTTMVLHIMIKNDLLVYRNVQNNKISLGYFFIITEEKHPKKGTSRGAHPVGFEPTTFRSVAERSIQLSYGCIIFNSINSYKLFIHRDPYFTDAGGAGACFSEWLLVAGK